MFVRRKLDQVLEIVCSGMLVSMVLLVLYQVFTRAVLGKPNTITEELVRFGLIWVSLLGAAYVVGKKSHLAVTLLSSYLKEAQKKRVAIIIQVLFILFASVVMIYGGSKGVSVTMHQVSPSMNIPMGYIYLAVPVSGALILIYSVLNLFDGQLLDDEE